MRKSGRLSHVLEQFAQVFADSKVKLDDFLALVLSGMLCPTTGQYRRQ